MLNKLIKNVVLALMILFSIGNTSENASEKIELNATSNESISKIIQKMHQ